MSRMNLREKIGALICPRVFGDRSGWNCFDFPQPQEFLERYPPASFIVFGGNRETTPGLLRWIRAEIVPRPPLFAADLEEGPGQQIAGATRYPPMMALGASRSEELAQELGAAIAEEANALGIRWLFGPVLDLARDPKNPVMGARSLGSDPARAETLASAFVRGVSEGGGIATGKHFPGHGSTPLDSHEELPTIELSLEWLEKSDLRPFKTLVAQKIPSIMVGHLCVPALESDVKCPTTFSSRIIEGYLRGKLGFDGVVVTDALMMGALKNDSPDSLGLRALQAGNDLLLMPGDPLATAQRIEEAVVRGGLSEKRIDRSLDRLQKLSTHNRERFRLNLEGKRLDRVFAEKSFTLIDPRKAFQPLRPGESISLHVWNECKAAEGFDALLRKEMGTRGIHVEENGRPVLFLLSDNRAWRGRAGYSQETLDQVLQVLTNAAPYPSPLIIGLCSPFALTPLLGKAPILLGYGFSPAGVETSLDILCGFLKAQGVLPINLP